MNFHVHLLVCSLVCQNFREGREFTLPCSSRITYLPSNDDHDDDENDDTKIAANHLYWTAVVLDRSNKPD